MIRRLLAAIGRKAIGDAPADDTVRGDRVLAEHPAPLVPTSVATGPLPTRNPGAALDAAVARYVAAGTPLYPEDELYVTASGAIVHTHHFTAEETAR